MGFPYKYGVPLSTKAMGGKIILERSWTPGFTTRSASAPMWVLKEPGWGCKASDSCDRIERGCGGGKRVVGADVCWGMGCGGAGAKQRGDGGRLLENKESDAAYRIVATADIVEEIARRAGFALPAAIFS